MKSFRNAFGFHGLIVVLALALGIAAASGAVGVGLLPAQWTIYGSLRDWLQNAESGSKIEAALYRQMPLPAGDVLFRRPPQESQAELTTLIQATTQPGSMYALRAFQDEQALDFPAAESDWKAWVDHSSDHIAAELDLASFYARRLRPQDQIHALEAVAQAPDPPDEKLIAVNEQRSWKAFTNILEVIQSYALGPDLTDQTYRLWIARYPTEPEVYSSYFDALLAAKRYSDAASLITQYRRAFPQDTVFPIKATAALAYQQGSVAEGIAVYDKVFDPLWPADLLQCYYGLLVQTHSLPAFIDHMRAKLAANPDDLNAATRLFFAYQHQGRSDTARQVVAQYRDSKEKRKATWAPQELYTFARLLQDAQFYPESARYYFALHSSSGTSDTQQRALSGLTTLLLQAPDQPMRLGAGNLSMYRNIATMDQGPGYFNGILSLFLNSTNPSGEYANEDRLATPYFHRAKAAELLGKLDQSFPNAPERSELHFQLIAAYAAYGEDDAVIRAGKEFLAQIPHAPQRIDVALTVADSYARTHRNDEEFALYNQLLRELATQAEGVPLGDGSVRYSRPVPGQPQPASGGFVPNLAPDAGAGSPDATGDQTDNQTPSPAPAQQQAFTTSRPAAVVGRVRSPQYEQVLDRYLSRLVAMKQLPQALAVLRGEVDHDPDDPGLYEKLAELLNQNQLGQNVEDVYKRAIQQFDDKSWYDKLARFYLRQRRNADYMALTQQVAKIFSGTELASYIAAAPAPGPQLSLEVNFYAHQRFPHDLTFTQNLLYLYRSRNTYDEKAAEKLLAENWFASEQLRNQFFELLAQQGKLESTIDVLKQQNTEVAKSDWDTAAIKNPAAVLFFTDTALWQSHFEEAAPGAASLTKRYPADAEYAAQASSLYRSLAYFHPEDTEQAIMIEKRLLDADPGNRDILARIGDIYADKERYADAAPYWIRMAEIRPGEPDGYLQSATIFWDYFDFVRAIAELEKGRRASGNPALYSYEEGAIYENQRDYPKAIGEYVRGAIANNGDTKCHDRLLALARRPSLASQLNGLTTNLLTQPNPSISTISLRADILSAQHKTTELVTEFSSLLDRSSSLEILEYISQLAQQQSLLPVQQHALERQITLTTDPTRKLELRYDLVHFYESNNDIVAAQSLVDSIYYENSKLLGVIRATVDFDWNHDRKQQAITVLETASHTAYFVLAQQFEFETARKLTDLGQYTQARTVLQSLLQASPFDSSAFALMSETYARAGDDAGLRDFNQSEIDALKASSLDRAARNDRIAALRRGLIPALTRLHQPAAVIDQYVELLKAYPEDAGLAAEAALYSGQNDQQTRLLDFFRTAVKDSPRDSHWPVILARLQVTLEDYPAAIAAYTQAIAIRPDRIDLHAARAALNEKLQHYDDAVADYETLYTLTYKDPSWLKKVAEDRTRQGKLDLAVAALESAIIKGRPQRASNDFEVAESLESWDMLEPALDFATKGVDIAGNDLLANPVNHAGAVLYARILTRLRKPEVVYAKLSSALNAAQQGPSLSAVVAHVEAEGIASVTDNQWQEREHQIRTTQAREGFAAALREMAVTSHRYDTPEETANLVSLLQAKAATASLQDIDQFFVPAARAGVLTSLESDLEWRLSSARDAGFSNRWMEWTSLQRSRLLEDSAARQLERIATTSREPEPRAIHSTAAGLYGEIGDTIGELRCLEAIGGLSETPGPERENYFSLLLAQKPQSLIQLASSGSTNSRDAAAQYTILNASPQLAFEAIAARGQGLEPVWNSSYASLTGFYLRQFNTTTTAAFQQALGDGTIADRIAHPVDRSHQLAGDLWFYYGARYGEYLSISKSADAADFLPSAIEQQPGSPGAYEQLAALYAIQGKTAQALDEYNLALQIRPSDPLIHNRVALLLWNQGRKADALQSWQRAVALLSKQIDAHPVPDTFWTSFSSVLIEIGAHKQLAAVRPLVDTTLRTYIRRNGSYMTEPLLRAVYRADGSTNDAVNWLLDLASAGNPPESILDDLVGATWISPSQRPLLYARLVALAAQSVTSSGGAARTSAENRRRQLQIDWLQSLLRVNQYAEAQTQLDAIPDNEKQTHAESWLPIAIQLAAHNGTLPALIQSWQQNNTAAPQAELLRQTAPLLEPVSRDLLRAYVYQSAIDSNDLSSPNFLGLAGIRIRQGDISGAVTLLNRLALVSPDTYADLEAAGSLFSETGHFKESLPFLKRLAAGVPWNTDDRLHLDQARIQAGDDATAARGDLAALASNPLAPYTTRVEAARTLGGSNTPGVSGSAELSLLARGTIQPSEARQAYFVAARIEAAKSASPRDRVSLLRQAIVIDPKDDIVRIALLHAAIATEDAHLIINAAQPLGGVTAIAYTQSTYAGGDEDLAADSNDSAPQPSGFASLDPSERAALYAGIGSAYRRNGDLQNALSYLRVAIRIEQDTTTRKPWIAEASTLRQIIHRNALNAARALSIHDGLDQNHIVQPRLEAAAERTQP